MKVFCFRNINLSLLTLLTLLTNNLIGSESTLPKNISDINGGEISFPLLSKNKTVCLITIKSVSCPVCIEQLKRFKKKILEFQKCNLTFLVLAYGSISSIKNLANKTKFPFPFIQDKNFAISKTFDLDNAPFEIIPSVILFNGDGTVKWKQTGRSYQFFSDQAIEDYLDCENWI